MKNNKKINILYLINGLGSGGTEKQLIELLLNIDRKLINPIVVYYIDENFFKGILIKNEIKLIYVPKKPSDKLLPWRLLEFIRILSHIIKKNDIDIIHSWGMGANFWARIIGMFLDCKVVISIRSTKVDSKISLLERLGIWHILERFMAKFASRIIVNSYSIKEIYLKRIKNYPENKIKIISNGFDFQKMRELDNFNRADLKNIYGFQNGKFIIINVSRVIEVKNQLCLLKALNKLVKRGIVNILVVFVGKEYAYYKKVKSYIKEKNLDSYVKFLGERSDVYQIIKASDLFVLSSLWEGFPNVVIEAMAIGTVVISSKINGVKKIIKEKETGFLFDLNNENDLVDKIIEIMNMPFSDLNNIKNKALEYVKSNFSIERMVNETTMVYLELF